MSEQKILLPPNTLIHMGLVKARVLFDSNPELDENGKADEVQSTSSLVGTLTADMFVSEHELRVAMLAEVDGVGFEPDRIATELRRGRKFQPSLTEVLDAHSDLSDEHFDLFLSLYDIKGSDEETESEDLFFNAAFDQVAHRYGNILLIEPDIYTDFYESFWIKPMAVQAFLDAAEPGYNLTIVDTRGLTQQDFQSAKDLFAIFGFQEALGFNGGRLLYRDPHFNNPRVSLKPPPSAFETGSSPPAAVPPSDKKLLN